MISFRRAVSAVLCVTGVSLAQVPPDKADSTFTVAPGFDWSLWAAEPMFTNPTSIDVDHRGRVWVCEAVNYRQILRGQPVLRPEGDRIVVLADAAGSGRADRATVFAQSPAIQAPLGIAVLPRPEGGQRVYVCQSPDILVFDDFDDDLVADGPPRQFLSGFQGIDHDHGVHGLFAGPDGKLYFSVGDQGVDRVRDRSGKLWSTNQTDCRAGTIWRCEPDGSGLELIAHNFRNQYEPAIDSFGTVFCSDNDDDGHQQTRICYVLPGGDHGYWPRGKGESHWHEEQPGVVPKILRTGFGSPTGLCVYEGGLFPEKYRGQLLHTDAGPRHVRCYHLKPDGAGYRAEAEILVSSRDNWFRPSDICIAPDGSAFVSDWYDPGVGGHGMGDTTRGRIYRLAPTGAAPTVPPLDLKTPDGLLAAWESPNLARQALARRVVAALPRDEALAVVRRALESADRPYLQARAAWLLPTIWKQFDGVVDGQVTPAGRDGDERFAVLNVRQRFENFGRLPEAEELRAAPIAVCREVALALRRLPTAEARPLFDVLLERHTAGDVFYRLALGIAVGPDPVRRDALLADFDRRFPDWTDAALDLTWELRPPSALARLANLLADAAEPSARRARAIDILAYSDDPKAAELLAAFVSADAPGELRDRASEQFRRNLPTRWKGYARSPDFGEQLDRWLADARTVRVGLELTAAAQRADRIDHIRELIRSAESSSEVRRAAVSALGQISAAAAVRALTEIVTGGATDEVAASAVAALGRQLDGRKATPAQADAIAVLEKLACGDSPLRPTAVTALGGSWLGSNRLLELHSAGALPDASRAETGRTLRSSPYQDVRNKALIAFPAPGKLDPSKLPEPRVLAQRVGRADQGRELMKASQTGDLQCLKCHRVHDEGGEIGPDLSKIGSKASRENLYESILFPDKAIADQFVQWQVTTDAGLVVSGLLVGETAEQLTLRDANGKDRVIMKSEVEQREKLATSLMPVDLVKLLTEDELADLIEYLLTLK